MNGLFLHFLHARRGATGAVLCAAAMAGAFFAAPLPARADAPAPAAAPPAQSQPTTAALTTTSAPAEAQEEVSPRLPSGQKELNLKDGPDRQIPFSPKGVMWQLLSSVLVIAVMGVGAYLVIKKLLPRLGKSVGKKHIRVLETTYLGPHKTVHLLQVGARKYLVASSRDGVSMLTEVSTAFQGAPEENTSG